MSSYTTAVNKNAWCTHIVPLIRSICYIDMVTCLVPTFLRPSAAKSEDFYFYILKKWLCFDVPEKTLLFMIKPTKICILKPLDTSNSQTCFAMNARYSSLSWTFYCRFNSSPFFCGVIFGFALFVGSLHASDKQYSCQFLNAFFSTLKRSILMKFRIEMILHGVK